VRQQHSGHWSPSDCINANDALLSQAPACYSLIYKAFSLYLVPRGFFRSWNAPLIWPRAVIWHLISRDNSEARHTHYYGARRVVILLFCMPTCQAVDILVPLHRSPLSQSFAIQSVLKVNCAKGVTKSCRIIMHTRGGAAIPEPISWQTIPKLTVV
jgi:hypothetical protein